jgi:hypothetical protein
MADAVPDRHPGEPCIDASVHAGALGPSRPTRPEGDEADDMPCFLPQFA